MASVVEEPRTGKRGEVVMDQLVELCGPRCCLVVAAVVDVIFEEEQ
jgi:hypothetical protein